MTKKTAISLPDDLFRDIERARKRSKKDRSTWIQEAAAFCTAQDPQLDLYGALPNDRRSSQPIVFQRRPAIRNADEAPAPAFTTQPAENEVYEPMFHG